MPLVYSGIKQGGVPGFTAWRWSFFVPGAMFLLLAMCTLMLAQDTPDGSYRDLRKRRTMQVSSLTSCTCRICNFIAKQVAWQSLSFQAGGAHLAKGMPAAKAGKQEGSRREAEESPRLRSAFRACPHFAYVQIDGKKTFLVGVKNYRCARPQDLVIHVQSSLFLMEMYAEDLQGIAPELQCFFSHLCLRANYM